MTRSALSPSSLARSLLLRYGGTHSSSYDKFTNQSRCVSNPNPNPERRNATGALSSRRPDPPNLSKTPSLLLPSFIFHLPSSLLFAVFTHL